MRRLPSVDELLRSDELKGALGKYARDLVAGVAREAVEAVRSEIVAGEKDSVEEGEVARAAVDRYRWAQVATEDGDSKQS